MLKELIKHNDTFYVVKRKIPVSHLTKKTGEVNSELFNGWKKYLNADKVLKTQTHFLYCENVDDAEWEDMPSEPLTEEPIGHGV